MGKLLNLCLLICVGLVALTGYREYQKLQYQLNQPPAQQFITQVEELIDQGNNEKEKSSQNKKSRKLSSQKSTKLQQSISQKLSPNIHLWLSNSISHTNHNLADILSTLSQHNKPYSIQQITFLQKNFTATGLAIYKLKQILHKYIFKHFYSSNNLTQQQSQTQAQLKIFDLRQWTDQQQLKKSIDHTLDSLDYLHSYQTGRLFWFQSMTGLLKSQKIKTQNIQIYAFILIDGSFRKKEFEKIKSYVQEYAELSGDVFEMITTGFQVRKQDNKRGRKNTKVKNKTQK